MSARFFPTRIATRCRLGAAAIIPPVAWYGYQQGLGITLRQDCIAASFPAGPLLGAGALLLCAVAALLAGSGQAAVLSPGRRLVSHLSRGSAAIFALAIGFQTLATILIPPCVA